MALTTDRELRRCCQWAFPGDFSGASVGPTSGEDQQTYINRAWTWKGTPRTAVEINAQEATWRAFLLTIPTTVRQQKADNLEFDEETVRAAFLVVLDEVNVIRTNAGLSVRTTQQFKNAIASKML